MTLTKLLITEVSGGLSHHHLLKIHQKVKTLTSLMVIKIISSDVVPSLSMAKPKSFPTASDNLEPIISVIDSFGKQPNIVKTKTLD